jgi:hypothetical protein
MAAMVDRVKTLVLYFDHECCALKSDFWDVVANPVASLPKVLSPCKFGMNEADNHEEDNNEAGTYGKEQLSDDSDSSDLSDFNDNDYEIGDDDALFDDYVDVDVSEGVVDRGKKRGRGTKTNDGTTYEGKQVIVPSDNEDEESTEDEEDGLQLPESDDESNPGLMSKSFREEDMVNLVFKVGMKFDSVQLLRNAIKEYGLIHRVEVSMPRNEKERVTAVCCKGNYPWKLHASNDKRVNSMIIKTYSAKHTCQKK